MKETDRLRYLKRTHINICYIHHAARDKRYSLNKQLATLIHVREIE